MIVEEQRGILLRSGRIAVYLLILRIAANAIIEDKNTQICRSFLGRESFLLRGMQDARLWVQ